MDGIRTIPLWQEYYLHLVGPILQWIDALFILGAFRPFKKILGLCVAITFAYVTWVEVIVGPFNAMPVGDVTTGLPYRFLNNLEFADRAVFYGQNILVSIVMVFVFAGIVWGLRKLNLVPR